MKIKVIVVYVCVVLVWATTPLAIQWSNSSFNFMAAVTLRMLIASLVCVVLLVLFRQKLIRTPNDWKTLLAGAFGLYPNMVLVYWSAQYIPSGLISIVLGVYPFLVGIFSIFILKQNPFNASRLLALAIAVLGLICIHLEQMDMGRSAVLGVLGILISAIFFAASTVCIKRLGGGVEPLRQLSGALLIATPFFAVTWLLIDGEIPQHIDVKSMAGVVYLVIAGSIIGGLGFYYVLRHCTVSTVSLIPLMTPVLAMFIGYTVEGEVLSTTAITGSVLILFSLAVYQGVLSRGYFLALRIRKWLVRNILSIGELMFER